MDEPFNCSWLAPPDLQGDVHNYSIQVRHNGTLIHSDFTTVNSYADRPGFVAVLGLDYEVTVRVITHAEGAPSSTKIDITNSG